MNATIIPTLKYTDAATAIDWLCNAFGCQKQLVVAGENGSGASAFDRLQKTPQAAGGVVTQSPYIVVEDVDAHCRRALDAGAQIVMPPADQDYGGRLYACRDPEGYLCNFGSYDPWA
jgi:uncharacterized glyoxalase superfamily protein PhnB